MPADSFAASCRLSENTTSLRSPDNGGLAKSRRSESGQDLRYLLKTGGVDGGGGPAAVSGKEMQPAREGAASGRGGLTD